VCVTVHQLLTWSKQKTCDMNGVSHSVYIGLVKMSFVLDFWRMSTQQTLDNTLVKGQPFRIVGKYVLRVSFNDSSKQHRSQVCALYKTSIKLSPKRNVDKPCLMSRVLNYMLIVFYIYNWFSVVS